MFKKKYIVYPGVPAKGLGVWWPTADKQYLINDKVSALTCYSDYFERDDPTVCTDYSGSTDWKGPQFYAPSQCLKTYSWNKPKMASPGIGIIGP